MNNISLSMANTPISKMSRIEILHLKNEIMNFSLPFREKLNLPKSVSFGIEIEYEDVDKKLVDDFIRKNMSSWMSTTDKTLVSGGEVVTPTLQDQIKAWQNLRKICEFLRQNKVNTAFNSAVHVHVGSHILHDKEAWRRFLKFYTVYERVFVRFAFGDKINARRSFLEYAAPIALKLLNDREKLEAGEFKSLDFMVNNKKVGLNIRGTRGYEKEGNTLEFRSFNSTDKETIIQNNVMVATNMMLTAAHNLDEDFLDYKLRQLSIQGLSPEQYFTSCGQIATAEALEFADLTFNNDFDKMCFLKQYFKGFENYNLKSGEAILSRGL